MSDMYDAERPNRRPRESKKSSPADADWLTGRSWDDIRAQLAESQRTGAKRSTGQGRNSRTFRAHSSAGSPQPQRDNTQPGTSHVRKRPPAPRNQANTGRGVSARGRSQTGVRTLHANPKTAPGAKNPRTTSKNARKKVGTQLRSTQLNIRDKAKLWGKRIFIGTVSIAVIVTLVIGGIYANKQIRNFTSANTAVANVPENDEVMPVPLCQPGDLDVQVSTNASTLQTGSHWKVKLVIKNKSARACYTEGGPNRFGISLKSGEVSVYESQKCAAKDAQIPLLLNPQKSWQMDLTWDAHVWANCKAGDVAKPGTYVATIFNQDKLVGEPHVLTVVPRPEPKPEPKTTDKPAEKPADKPE